MQFLIFLCKIILALPTNILTIDIEFMHRSHVLLYIQKNQLIYILMLIFFDFYSMEYKYYKHITTKLKLQPHMKLFYLLCLIFLVGVNCYYDTALASPMIYFSVASYGLPQKIQNWDCLSCKRYKAESIHVFNIPFLKLQGFVGYYAEKDTVFVAFRGTSNFQNKILDLDFRQTKYPACKGCKVHEGFYISYNSAAITVRKYIKQLLDIYQGAKITVTGHSLGAALAVLCALDLQEIYGDINLYTFGCPRVGNAAFAEYSQKKIPQSYRIVNYADAITQIPLESLGYRHGGNQVWYSPRGMQKYRICRSEDHTCGKSVDFISFMDHNYLYYQKLRVQNNGQLR